MADQLPNMGHLPEIIKGLLDENDAKPKSCLLLLHSVADSNVSAFSGIAILLLWKRSMSEIVVQLFCV